MKSDLEFFDFDTNQKSDCGDSLEIEISNRDLGWEGVILEKGTSPTFFPNNVYTPYFYFALAIEQDLNWKAGIDGGMKPLKTFPGDIWINPPKTPFSHEIDEPCYFIILAVEESVFLKSTTLPLNESELRFLNNYNVSDATLRGIIELFLEEVKSGGKNGHAYYRNLLSLISTYYLNNYSNYRDLRNSSYSTSKISRAGIELIDQYISEHMDQAISIEKLAERLNYSKYYFLREFKKLKGITPYQYVIEKKMNRAKRLLMLQDHSIADISYRLGFSDQAYFTHVFKKHTGQTPGQFQKQALSHPSR